MDKNSIINQLLSRNYSLPTQTTLNPQDIFAFANWVKQNKVPLDLSKRSDYDMPGFYKDPNAESEISPIDNQLHFTDKYKTPLHKSFSQESIYSDNTAPVWEGPLLKSPEGNTVGMETPKGFESVKRKALQNLASR